MKWSKFQKAIYKEVANGKGHLVVEATAGSGKTTCLLESLNHVPEDKTWLLAAFNKKIAEELKYRAPSSYNGDCRTLHSLGMRALGRRIKNLKVENNKNRILLDKIVGKDKKLWDLKQNIAKTVSLCKSYLIDGAEFISHVMDNHTIDTCDIDRDQFINYVQECLKAAREETRFIDFDDMIWMPHVYNIPTQKYDFVFLDEAQDLNNGQMALALKTAKRGGRIISWGDTYQCVSEDTEVTVEGGEKVTIGKITEGDKILSYHNGKEVYRTVNNKVLSSWSDGIEIITNSGYTLLMSPNHKIWSTLPDGLKPEQYIVYLMYRKDLGFRIGKTNAFGAKTSSERADKLWILGIFESNEEAILEEESLSLEFGIPKAAFNGTTRDLNQDRIDELFKRHGQNGLKLLEQRNLSFNFSHWTGRGCTDKNSSSLRRVIIRSHNKKNYSKVSFEWTDSEICSILDENNIPYSNGSNRRGNPNFRLRRCFTDYIDAIAFAERLSYVTDSYVIEHLSFDRQRPLLVTASCLLVGSSVLVRTNEGLKLDKIFEINSKPGIFYDLEIDKTANFFGNDVLSHNSIYQFRGASLSAMDNIVKKLNAKTLPLSITYRCPLSVVKEAQQLVPEIQAAPNAPEGKVEEISRATMVKQAEPGCFILSRANAPLIGLALGFIRKGKPAVIQGRDIGQNLLNLIKKSRRKSLDGFMTWLNRWEAKEVARLRKKKGNISLITDKAACMRALAEACHDLTEVKNKIKTLFEDTDEHGKIVLSSVHKAKGLERDVVYMLMSTFKTHTQEERNIKYVAITRSARSLFYVVSNARK